MVPALQLTFAPPSGENFAAYVNLPVIIEETAGVTHISLWTDPTVRPAGVIKYADDVADGLCTVVVNGPAKVKVGAATLQAGAHRLVCCTGAGEDDPTKAKITALAAGNDYFALGDFLGSADVAAGGTADIVVNPGQIAIA